MKDIKKWFTGLALALLALSLVACTSTKESTSKKLKVVATNSIIADITKNIAGDKIDLHSIVPVGKDPHEYEVLPEDLKKARRRTSFSTMGLISKRVALLGFQN